MSSPGDEPLATADDARYDRERAFHDERFADDDRPANRFYDITTELEAHYRSCVDSLAPDAHVLDFGCGPDAATSLRLAGAGRRVTAIDISSVAIAQATERATAAGVADRIEFITMNAETLPFADGSYDAVVGTGVLHHLELRRSFSEIARVLTDDGRAIFSEPLGHNPLINLYRDRTPGQRTPDEHPLLTADLDLARTFFAEVDTRSFVLTGLVLLPFGRARRSERARTALSALDDRLMARVPALQRYAWHVVLDMRRPLRAA